MAVGASCDTAALAQFKGTFVILSGTDLSRLYQLGVGARGVIRALWHPKINQILLGLSDGTVKVWFDPERSNK